MKYHEFFIASKEKAGRDKKAVLLSVALHLVVFLIFFMMPSTVYVSGDNVLFVNLQSDAALPAGMQKADIRTPAPLPVKPFRKNHTVTDLPAGAVDTIHRLSNEENKEVMIREQDVSVDMPRKKDDEGGRTAAAPATESHSSGYSKAGIVDGKIPGGNKISIAEARFGDRGAPAFVYQEIPVYPALARRLGMEGRVLLKLLIDANGKLLNVEVIESAGYGFTEASIEAVKKSTYAPGVRDGVKVATLALLPVRFRLQ